MKRSWARETRDILLATVVLLGLLNCFQPSRAAQSDKAEANTPAPNGRLIDLDGYKLHLDCRGAGSPTVVLSAGAGDFSFDWALVQPEVARFARVCSYDRGGEAWSDLGPSPRTIQQEVFDLHRLLAAAGEHPPYLLVGQSLGGMIARLFAMQYPGEISGIVLVDSSHEDAQLFLNGKLVRIRTAAQKRPIPPPRSSTDAADGLGSEETEQITEMISQFEITPSIDAPFDKLPEAARQQRLWALGQLKHFAAGSNPYFAEELQAIYEETHKQPYPLGDLPLTVLSRSRDEYPPEHASLLSAEHRKQQESLAQLSRRGTQIVVPNSGHHIQLDAPDAVIRAIRSLATGAD
jgi:pimeloyl-ACP methyl ester carboxylesterase